MTNDELFTFTDNIGNMFHCRNNQLSLKCKNASRIRSIGEIIDKNNLVIFKKYEDANHIHQLTNSWSVPLEIFNKVDGIWFYTKKFDYKILTKKVRKPLNICNFNGMETKVLIPLKDWHKDEKK